MGWFEKSNRTYSCIVLYVIWSYRYLFWSNHRRHVLLFGVARSCTIFLYACFNLKYLCALLKSFMICICLMMSTDNKFDDILKLKALLWEQFQFIMKHTSVSAANVFARSARFSDSAASITGKGREISVELLKIK